MSKLHVVFAVLLAPLAIFSAQAQPTPAHGTAIVSGIVILKGEPVRGASVQLIYEAPYLGTRINYSDCTDENGRFQITHVDAGNYWIRAQAPGYISRGPYDGVGDSLFHVTEGGKIENLAIEIRRDGAITGRITDSQGKPVIEEDVILYKLYKLDKHGKPQGFRART